MSQAKPATSRASWWAMNILSTPSKVDTILFTKKIGNDLFVLQIYVDDIIFGSTNQDFYEEFGKMMTNEFEMSMIG